MAGEKLFTQGKNDSGDANIKPSNFKLIIRRLPRDLTEEDLLTQLGPLENHGAFWFRRSNKELTPYAFSRAYVVFDNQKDATEFRNRFNGYVFIDKQGNESRAMVELAVHQDIPKKFPSNAVACDKRVGTLESRTDYQNFLDEYNNMILQKVTNFDELIREVEEKEKRLKQGVVQETPLTEFLIKQALEKGRKRIARLERHKPRQMKIEEKDVKKIKNRDKEKDIKREKKNLRDKKKEREDVKRPKSEVAKKEVDKSEKEQKEVKSEQKEVETTEKKSSRRQRRHEHDKDENKGKKTVRLLPKGKTLSELLSEPQSKPESSSKTDPSNVSKDRPPSVLTPDPKPVENKDRVKTLTAESEQQSKESSRRRRAERPERQIYRPVRAREKENKEKPKTEPSKG